MASRENFESDVRCSQVFGFVDRLLSSVFFSYGKFVSRHKVYFLFIPLLFVIISALGVLNLKFNGDVEDQFSPDDSQAIKDRRLAKSLFPDGEQAEFVPSRSLESHWARGLLIITSKSNSNVLNNGVLREVINIDDLVQNFEIRDEFDQPFSYQNVCMKWNNHCLRTNPLVDIAKNYLATGMDVENITYPTYFMPTKNGVKVPIFLGYQFRKVELIPGTDAIKTVKGFSMIYPLSLLNKHTEMNSLWEDQFEDHLRNFSKTKANFVQILPSTSKSLFKEVNGATISVLPRFVLTVCLLVIFSVLCMMTTDWVLSKPFLAFGGVLSATFAIISAIGLLSTIGVEFIQMVSMMPFLIIGVGVDNMFIMVTAWRQCNQRLSIQDRMAETLSEAAVSITITNLTDVVAFLIGGVSPLSGMRIFCIYAGVAIAFVYIYQITFFAACLAISGVREKRERHSVTCQVVVSKEESPSIAYSIFCAGGVPKDRAVPFDWHNTHRFLLVTFFEKYFGPFVMHRYVRTVTIMATIGVLGGALYGCTQIKEGLRLQNLARDFSPTWEYYSKSNELEDFTPTINIIFNDKLKYWTSDDQEKIERITQSFEDHNFTFSSTETESWLRAFIKYLKEKCGASAMPKCEFLQKLDEFLKDPRFNKFKLDIVYDDGVYHRPVPLKLLQNSSSYEIEIPQTCNSIKASRLLIPSRGLKDSIAEKDLMLDMRRIAENSIYNVTAYSPIFVTTEQYHNVLTYTLQILCFAITCMFIITLIIIPHPLCSVWITLCAISIDVCVLGYMSLWGISLDILSMINLVLCIGFSVDFSAHIAYAFMTSSQKGTKRGISALAKLGTPILQGGLSSMIAIFPLQSASVYIFRSFFKTLFLVMIMGLFHGLLVLPTILTQLQKYIPNKELKLKNDDSNSVPTIHQSSSSVPASHYPNSSLYTTHYSKSSNCVEKTTAEEEALEMIVSSI